VVQLAPYIGGTALTLVSAGVGICFVQESSAEANKPSNVVLRPVGGLDSRAILSVLWDAAAPTLALNAFLQIVRRTRSATEQR
jgi:DNA-binding transcriptional LysR family regulator